MVVINTIILDEIFDECTSLSTMKTKTSPQPTCAKNPVGVKSVTLKSCKKKLSSSQPKCTNKERLTKNKPVLDVESICTYHLVQITLERVEKLLKELSSKPSGRIGAVKTTVTKPVNNKPVNKNAEEGVNTVAKTPSTSEPSQRLEPNGETTPKQPVTKYRWVADVREGAPGFADDDRCTSDWFNSREAAEKDMNDNVEEKCSQRFPYLRWIQNVYIEEKQILN